MESLDSFRPTLDRLGRARGAIEMIWELGKAISEVNHCRLKRMPVI